MFVSTSKGDGLIPLRELPLPPGSDHRKLFPVGKELTLVVLDANAQGKLRFSATRVARVEEEQNFRDFAASSAAPAAAEPTATAPAQKKPPATTGFGSLGDLMREKFGGAAAAAAPKQAAPKQAAPKQAAPKQAAASKPQANTVTQPERADVIKRKR